jgi:hypothetical protein
MLERERWRVQLPCHELLGSDGNRQCQRDAGKAWYLQTFGVVSTWSTPQTMTGNEASVVELHAWTIGAGTEEREQRVRFV